jgi:hypothetical protein
MSDTLLLKEDVIEYILEIEQGLPGGRGITGAQGIQGLTGEQGFTGAQGTQGITGIQGERGPMAESYTHEQAIPLAVWVVNHPLLRMPSVAIVDSAGSNVEGEIRYDSNTQITITFSAAFSGYAYLN